MLASWIHAGIMDKPDYRLHREESSYNQKWIVFLFRLSARELHTCKYVTTDTLPIDNVTEEIFTENVYPAVRGS